MNGSTDLQLTRRLAAASANADDAPVWRWFSALIEERRIRWCHANSEWLISVDHPHLATSPSFDSAVRQAKIRSEGRRTARRRSDRSSQP